MSERISIPELEPDAYKTLYGFERYIDESSVTKTHKELIYIRASRINGCAFCLDKQTKDARKSGEAVQRMYVLSAWRETPFFTEKERVILDLTEEITEIQNGLSDETYNRALQILREKYLAQVIVAMIVINALNRIGVSTRLGFALNNIAAI